MPRAGQRYGGAVPACIQHYEVKFGIRLRVRHLTKTLRQLAQTDNAVAEYLRRRVSNPDRWDAFFSGRGWFYGRQCTRCGSTRRRTYDAACLDCYVTRRPLQLRPNNRIAAWPPASQSRAGFLDRAERSKLPAESQSFGPFEVVAHPLGQLEVRAPSLGVNYPDLRDVPFESINKLVVLHPEFLDLLVWAGWST